MAHPHNTARKHNDRRERHADRPRRLRRAFLTPLVAAAAVLMLAMPASAQLSGSLSGSASTDASLPDAALPEADLPNASADVSLDIDQDIQADAPQVPEVDIEGHTYQVISYTDMVASQTQGQTRLCGSLDADSATAGVQAPTGLSSYADVCGHLDAYALYTDSQGIVQAAQLPDTSWVTMPDLHQEVSIDIEADARADTGFIEEAVGHVKAAGEATAEGAKSFAQGIKAGFEVSVDFFGGLF